MAEMKTKGISVFRNCRGVRLSLAMQVFLLRFWILTAQQRQQGERHPTNNGLHVNLAESRLMRRETLLSWVSWMVYSNWSTRLKRRKVNGDSNFHFLLAIFIQIPNLGGKQLCALLNPTKSFINLYFGI